MRTYHTPEASDVLVGTIFSESLALGIVLYAEMDPAFRNTLGNIKTSESPAHSLPKCGPYIGLLIPQTEETARKRAEWIARYGNTRAKEYLAYASAKDRPYQDPKAIVLGITLGVMPIGVLGHDKPGKKISVLFNEDMHDTASMISGGTRASVTLFERSVKEAGGDLARLEPDMADWFFGEKELAFFRTSHRTMRRICEELSYLDVPFASVQDEYGASILAVNPVVNPETISLHFDVEELEQ